MNDHILHPDDYLEPACPLCPDPAAGEQRQVPQQRIIEKMDEYMARRDYAGAERHLKYWLSEAEQIGDLRGQLMLNNELIGHYRKTGERDRAMAAIRRALELIDSMDFAETISAGTTYVNAATACNAFGDDERAAELFERARNLYESSPHTRPELLGGLYNNMALTMVSLSRYREADQLYQKALQVMASIPGKEPEQAITLLNMADALEAELGPEDAEKQICEYLDRAQELLDSEKTERDGYYAFVCEKCAPVFSHYGYFAEAQELQRRAVKGYISDDDERT